MSLCIDIVSGFLGAGKTTLIRKLLQETLDDRPTAIIENEFGEVSIDGELVQKGSVEVREITAGCICCSLQGDFREALQELESLYKPERIIIEPSGVGKLSEVLEAVGHYTQESIKGTVRLLVTVADARNFFLYLDNFSEFYKDQLTHAQTVLLSRSSQVEEEDLVKISAAVRELNEKAQIITDPWNSFHASRLLEPGPGPAGSSRKFGGEKRDEKTVQPPTPSAGKNRQVDSMDTGLTDDTGSLDPNSDLPALLALNMADTPSPSLQSWSTKTSNHYKEEELEEILKKLDSSDTFGQVIRAKGPGQGRPDSFDRHGRYAYQRPAPHFEKY